MNPSHERRVLTGQSHGTRWLQRALLAMVAAGLAISAVFFLVFALIAGAAIALLIGVRVWWVMRKLRAQQKATEALEGEYTVIEGARATERLER